MTIQLHTPEQAARWLREHVTGNLLTDSRKVGDGDGFIAWPGAATDGRRYVADVLDSGARACLVEYEGAAVYGFTNPQVAFYKGLKVAAGPLAAAYFDAPSQYLQVIAVTGTNGKTSTSWWLAQALGRLGRKCGVVGTLGIGEPGAMVLNGLTTPDPVLLQQQLRRFVDEDFAACVLEASSIGIEEGRLDGTQLQIAIFTNFTQDHLDYHGSMQAYWKAKKSLFDWPGLKAVVINIDDSKGAELHALLSETGQDVWTFSCSGAARLEARNIQQAMQTMRFDVVEGTESHNLSTQLVGLYNVYNLLGVIAALRAMNVSLTDAVASCVDLLPVPGRMDTLALEGFPLVVIDYAHTPDALEKVLSALKHVATHRGGRLWCVFGCGGDRDASKRPLMGAMAEKISDEVVITSDNPRSEDPQVIIDQVVSGLSCPSSAHVKIFRDVAITDVICFAQPEDVVLLAGKGHEDFQEISGVKFPFSDRVHAQTALNNVRAKRQSQGDVA